MESRITQSDIQKIKKTIEKMQGLIDEVFAIKKQLMQAMKKPAQELSVEDIGCIELLTKKADQLVTIRDKDALRLIEKIKNLTLLEAHIPLMANTFHDDASKYKVENNKGDLKKAQTLKPQLEKLADEAKKIKELRDLFNRKIKLKEDKDKNDKRAEEVKGAFFEHQDEVSCLIMIDENGNEKVISSKEMRLMERGVLPTPNYYEGLDQAFSGDTSYFRSEPSKFEALHFISYDEATPEQQQKIKDKENKINNIRTNSDRRFDRTGIITIQLARESTEPNTLKGYSVSLTTTQRAIADAGLDPDDFAFEKMSKIDLLKATMDRSVTRQDIAKARDLFTKLRTNNLTQEKGEV